MTSSPGYRREGLWLIGGGGHAVVVAEAAQLSGRRVSGYFDDRDDAGVPGCIRLGPISDVTKHNVCDNPIVLAVGDLTMRASWIKRIHGLFDSVIHPTAIVAPSARIAAGSFLGAGAVVNSCALLQQHTIVNTRAVVEHGCSLGVNSHVGPGAILGGGVIVGSNTLIGINASIRPNIVIGNACTVGAGATVVRDVPDGAIVVGVPARPIASSRWRRTA